MSTIYERIKQRRLELGLTQDELAHRMGYTSRSTINKIESGKVDIARNKIAKFAEVLNVPPSYLMGWDESYASIITNPSDSVNFIDAKDYSSYTYVPYGVSAGALMNIDGTTELETVTLPDCMLGPYAGRNDVIFMNVNGDSMNKLFDDGSIILVEQLSSFDNLHDEDVAVVCLEGEYTVKHFIRDDDNQRVILRPDSANSCHTDIIIPYEQAEELTLIGRVVMFMTLI